MATKFIIAKGIGFSPGSVKYIPTHGLIASGAVVAVTARRLLTLLLMGR